MILQASDYQELSHRNQNNLENQRKNQKKNQTTKIEITIRTIQKSDNYSKHSTSRQKYQNRHQDRQHRPKTHQNNQHRTNQHKINPNRNTTQEKPKYRSFWDKCRAQEQELREQDQAWEEGEETPQEITPLDRWGRKQPQEQYNNQPRSAHSRRLKQESRSYSMETQQTDTGLKNGSYT